MQKQIIKIYNSEININWNFYIDLSKREIFLPKQLADYFRIELLFTTCSKNRIQKSFLRNITGFARRICSFLYNENAFLSWFAHSWMHVNRCSRCFNFLACFFFKRLRENINYRRNGTDKISTHHHFFHVMKFLINEFLSALKIFITSNVKRKNYFSLFFFTLLLSSFLNRKLFAIFF